MVIFEFGIPLNYVELFGLSRAQVFHKWDSAFPFL